MKGSANSRNFPLTKSQQELLLRAIKRGLDGSDINIKVKAKAAERKLITASQLIVLKIAEKYVGKKGKNIDELVRIGNIGLNRAIKKWIEGDVKRKYHFIVYATWFVRREICKELGLRIESK